MAVASNVPASITSVKVKFKIPVCTTKEKLCSSGLVTSGRWIRAWMGPVDSIPFPAVSKTDSAAMTKKVLDSFVAKFSLSLMVAMFSELRESIALIEATIWMFVTSPGTSWIMAEALISADCSTNPLMFKVFSIMGSSNVISNVSALISSMNDVSMGGEISAVKLAT